VVAKADINGKTIDDKGRIDQNTSERQIAN